MRRLMKSLVLSAAVALAMAPAAARADGWVNPWAGVNFGADVEDGRGAFGVNAGGMGAGIIGGEIGFGYSPSFFGAENDFGNNTVIDLMGNVIVGLPFGGQRGAGLRPYVVGGLGLIRTQIDGGTLFDVSISDNHFGWNAGAGVMGFFNDHIGVRADLRYLSNFSDSTSLDSLDFDGTFNYWRASFGIVIR